MAGNQAPQSVGNRNIPITDEGEGNADVAQPDNTPEDDIDINIEEDNQDSEENRDDGIIIHESEPGSDMEIEDSSTQSEQTPPTGAPAMPPPPPPPPPSEPPEPPVEEASEEEAEQPETSPEEEREERQDYLLELIDDFADLSDEELAGMTEFQELSTKEKVVKVLKTGARRAVVYAVVGVGAYALLHAAPVVIAAGAVGGFAGSSLGRGLVDAVKWISGAEKKERAMQEELSNIEIEKLTNLRNLALRARTLMGMPAGQEQSEETGQIETAEQAKANFLNALIEYNDSQSQSNRQIAGLRKKLSRSRFGWGVAKGVVGLVGGIAGGMAGAAELKAVLAEKIAEKGIHMTGEGLGQLDPGVAVGHNVHLENGEVVFDYAGGIGGRELAEVFNKIAENPELAQYFQSELISRGMHEAGDALGQKFMQRVGQVASERAAEYVAGAVGVAEATDAVWRNARRNRPDSWVRGASDEVRGEAGEYRADLQAEAGARQNERFRSMFVDQSGQIPEGVPSIGESIVIEQRFSLGSHEGEIVINPGDHLQILGLDQNGNILATHTETGQILAFQRDEFYQNIIQPRVLSEPEIEEEGEEAPIEETEETEEESPIESPENSGQGETGNNKEAGGDSPEGDDGDEEKRRQIEIERDELAGSEQNITVGNFVGGRKNQFYCEINGIKRRVTLLENPPREISTGENIRIRINENVGNPSSDGVCGSQNQLIRAKVVELPDITNSEEAEEGQEKEVERVPYVGWGELLTKVHESGGSVSRIISENAPDIDVRRIYELQTHVHGRTNDLTAEEWNELMELKTRAIQVLEEWLENRQRETDLREKSKEWLSPGSVWVHRGDSNYNQLRPMDQPEKKIDCTDKSFVLDRIDKANRRWFVEIHQLDQTGEEAKFRVDPQKFRQVLIPKAIAEMPNSKEKDQAREILLDEFKKMLDKTPALVDADDYTNAPEESEVSSEKVAQSETVENGRKFEPINRADELTVGDRIFVRDDVLANAEISTAGGEKNRSLVRDFPRKAEFVFNGPADTSLGSGMYEIERDGVKYHVFDDDITNNFMVINKTTEDETSALKDSEVSETTTEGEIHLINLKPGQVWRWETDSGENEGYTNFVIETLRKGVDDDGNETLKIKFRDQQEVEKTIDEWKSIFDAGNLIGSE